MYLLIELYDENGALLPTGRQRGIVDVACDHDGPGRRLTASAPRGEGGQPVSVINVEEAVGIAGGYSVRGTDPQTGHRQRWTLLKIGTENGH